MYDEEEILSIMKIIWENEGYDLDYKKKWDDLFEYPINDSDRHRIMARLRRAATKILTYQSEKGKTTP